MRAALLAVACVLVASTARAQPDLPPPPPPPLSTTSDVPPPPLPRTAPAPTPAPSSTAPSPPPARVEPTPPPPPPYAAHPHRRREVVVVAEEPVGRPVAITLNPAALVVGRLSANAELLLAPHHALVLSPNVLVFGANRGGRNDLASDALGFATRTSQSFGGELGYHYWWRWRQSLAGPFFGPSLLLGSMTNASVGNANTTQLYWGGAFDAGGQAVLPGGFTLGLGIGIGFVELASTEAVFPRFLLQLGWSF